MPIIILFKVKITINKILRDALDLTLPNMNSF